MIARLSLILLALSPAISISFSPEIKYERRSSTQSTTRALLFKHEDTVSVATRRDVILKSGMLAAGTLISTLLGSSTPAYAAIRPPLSDLLYTIVRVREATEQESRLIRTGKFKDVQRANIKLAVKFMVENYRLADTLVGAAAYIEGTDRRIEAGQVGQNVVQNLLTILEYFDAADVQNLKVGSDSLAGKEQIVLKGLEAARRNLDSFLGYFPASEVADAKDRVTTENALNVKEFDPAIGVIINLQPAP